MYGRKSEVTNIKIFGGGYDTHQVRKTLAPGSKMNWIKCVQRSVVVVDMSGGLTVVQILLQNMVCT